MKSIQNKHLAGSELTFGLRTYRGDAAGVFDMEDAHADMLAGTPGWSMSAAPAAKPEAFDPVAALRERVDPAAVTPPAPTTPPVAPPAPTPPQAAPEPPVAPEPEPEAAEEPEDGDDGDDGEEVDLDAITSKKGMFEVAKRFDVPLSNDERKLSLDELRQLLDQRMFGEEG